MNLDPAYATSMIDHAGAAGGERYAQRLLARELAVQ
jgi:hypothetical protein